MLPCITDEYDAISFNVSFNFLPSFWHLANGWRPYAGNLGCCCFFMFRKIFAAGFLGFYKGMNTKIIQSILAAALLMAVKEKMTQAALLILNPKPALLPPAAKVSLTMSRKDEWFMTSLSIPQNLNSRTSLSWDGKWHIEALQHLCWESAINALNAFTLSSVLVSMCSFACFYHKSIYSCFFTLRLGRCL